jgi:signal transduction histidine kinase
MVPATIVAIAAVVIWAPAERAMQRDPGIRRLATAPLVRWIVGAVLAIAGVAALADRTGGLRDVGRSISAIAIAIAGIGVIAAPALGRLLATLDTERTLRIREEERAAVAAHLHDSVLQSLVLIQRSDDPRRMVSLARRQERELRSWLYGTRPVGEPTSLTAAVESMAATIELDHGVRIEAVTVGDAPIDEPTRAFLGALKEAATNAARHSLADHVDVYVEADDSELTGFVRDTGVGFDPAAVPTDRHGIADSIVGRIDRAGGRAVVTSRPGGGTEVEIELPRPRVMRMGPQA